MDNNILEIVEEEITNNKSLEEMQLLLMQKGFSDKDIQSAMQKYSHKIGSKKAKRNVTLFTSKEIMDRIGYGFATHQYINILFYIIAQAAGLGSIALFLVGIINGAKNLLTIIISSLVEEYEKVKQLSKKVMSYGGILFGFSFLFIAFSIVIKSIPLFSVALLLGSIGVVSYGDLYKKLLTQNLKKERMGIFLRKISEYGVIITAICLLISGYLLQTIPMEGKIITIFGHQFKAYGYLISFEITAFAFILSGYILSKIKQKKREDTGKFSIAKYYLNLKQDCSTLFTNKKVILLMIASMLAAIIQTIGNSYYGIFIYTTFHDIAFKGFLNVAIIYAIAILISMLGPFFAKKLHRTIGFSPMLVFGTLLVAMTPFFAAFKATLQTVGIAVSLSIIGAAILGFSQGLLAAKLLSAQQRTLYFKTVSILIILPFILFIPLSAWYANTYGMQELFKVLVYVLVGLVTPLYIILVGMASRQRL